MNEHEYFEKSKTERTKYSWNERNVFELWVISIVNISPTFSSEPNMGVIKCTPVLSTRF